MTAIWGTIIGAIDALARETMLFAAIGFLIGGIDDLVIDLIYIGSRARQRFRRAVVIADLVPPPLPGRLAVFVPAWDESAVIEAMLTAALARFEHPDYRIFVGCYPNDPATIDGVVTVAARDLRVRCVVLDHDGPTTKADCLNTLWRALAEADEAAGLRTRAIILHDAEDVVHPAELRVYDALLQAHDIVQIPVLPLIDRKARLVSGHYADEFAESHTKQLVVRVALGAGLPLAGVGCAVSVSALESIAGGDNAPFDATSLTEDYELGLRLAAMGRSACFARIREYHGGPVVAVRAYFPSSARAAVVQKARWMTGIALAGWDRIGWGDTLDIGEHWMRMRDRRAPIAILVLAAAYIALIGWFVSALLHALAGTRPTSWGAGVGMLLTVNTLLVVWRLLARAVMTSRVYGWREGLWSIPRVLVANYIALLAARDAVPRYLATLRGNPPRWDKTAHVFPTDVADAIGG